MKIAVAGGTGTVGRHVVEVSRERGHETVVLTRSEGVDLTTGEGLAGALDGVDAVIDVSNITSMSARSAARFFTTVSRTLLAAEQAAGVRRHVLLSIVGIDRAPYGYYAAKLEQEHVVEQGRVPWTILRAMQFHEFAGQMLAGLTIAGVHLAPKVRTQPVAAREVAEHLVALAEGAPAGRAGELAGPKPERLDDMVRLLAEKTGVRGPVVPISLPLRQFRAMHRGETMPGPGAMLGRQTFAEWVHDQASVAK